MDGVIFVKAQKEDIPAIMQVVAQGQAFLKQCGVDQWNDGYPTPEIIETDIINSHGYVGKINGEIAAYFAFGFEIEEDYIDITDGGWFTDTVNDKYLTVHRTVVSDTCRGKGIGKRMLAFGCETAKKLGIGSVRVDTHADNAVMRSVIDKLGFSYRGKILIDGLLPRVAYEKLII